MGIRSWGIDPSWTLFLDRDGVINRRIFGGYVRNFSEFHFQEGVCDALKKAKHCFARIIIVTNQQGVAKGIMTASELSELHEAMQTEIMRAGGKIDAVFAAVEWAEEQPSRRKPSPAMGLEAKALFPEINFEKAIMIGDTDNDLAFGQALSMKTVLIKSEEKVNRIPDEIVSSLYDLIQQV